jgi:hypothetical protein
LRAFDCGAGIKWLHKKRGLTQLFHVVIYCRVSMDEYFA